MLLRTRSRVVGLVLSIVCVSTATDDVRGQFIQRTVGGVLISPKGVLQQAPATLTAEKVAQLRIQMNGIRPEIRQATPWRTISLRELQQTLRTSQEIPDEIRYLGGLQRVASIIVDPENQDLLLCGPCDEWTIHPSGDLVGATNGQPVLLLDDLLIALRSVEPSRQHGISCSIDPTPQGRQALDAYLAQVHQMNAGVARHIEEVLGDQVVTIEGVQRDSHFAAVLAAADYQMKRYAMHLQPAPNSKLPSFLQLIQARSAVANNLTPRWWLTVEYPRPECSEDRRSWLLPESSVKVLTEDELVQADGSVQASGRVHPVAKRWADNFTSQFDQLAQVDVVFARLRQVMDWALVAAVIDHHQLGPAAGCDLTLLAEPSSSLKTELWATPQSVPSHASFIRVGRRFVITASGGVQMDPWAVVGEPGIHPELSSASAGSRRRELTSWCHDVE